MKRLILALCLLLPGVALAQNCIPSGNTTSYTYFVAVDATDLVTRETGLSSFTVRRSRNGGASAAFTTPTVNETDSSNMPGVYELLLDEDMTIGSGNDVEHMTLHITHAGMAPVTKEICIARPKITVGHTLDVTSGGNAGIDLDNVSLTNGAPAFGIAASGTLSGTHSSTTADLGANAPSSDVDVIGKTLAIAGRAARFITDYNPSTGVATFAETDATPTNGDVWVLWDSAPGEGGSGGGLDAEGIRDAIGLASANLDTQLSTIDSNVDAILDDTGTSGVVVASGSKTGYSIGSGGITSSSFANDAITAAATASDFGAEVRTGLATGTSLSTLQGDVTTLLSRLTSTRAGYLDKLNITGNVASSGAVETIDDVVDGLMAILEKLDTAMEADGEEYRFTANALEQAPAGEGGGSNITQIEGQDATDVLDARIAAQLATYDPPTRAELTSDKEAILAAISGLNDLSTSDIRGIVVEPNGSRSLGCYLAAAGAILFGTSSTTDGETEYRDPSGTSVRVTGTASAAGTRSASITCPTY